MTSALHKPLRAPRSSSSRRSRVHHRGHCVKLVKYFIVFASLHRALTKAENVPRRPRYWPSHIPKAQPSLRPHRSEPSRSMREPQRPAAIDVLSTPVRSTNSTGIFRSARSNCYIVSCLAHNYDGMAFLTVEDCCRKIPNRFRSRASCPHTCPPVSAVPEPSATALDNNPVVPSRDREKRSNPDELKEGKFVKSLHRTPRDEPKKGSGDEEVPRDDTCIAAHRRRSAARSYSEAQPGRARAQDTTDSEYLASDRF